MFTDEQRQALSAKLDASRVKQRAQAGRQLSYIEGWHAIAEANRIFGFDGWDRETVELRQTNEAYQTPQVDQQGNPKKDRDGNPIMNWRVAYMARVRVVVSTMCEQDDTKRRVTRDGCGFGSGIDRDLGQAHESAIKEAETDAMKRALMTFGNPFGLALYDKAQTDVERPTQAKQLAADKPAAEPKRTVKDLQIELEKGALDCQTKQQLAAWEAANADKLAWLKDKHPAIELEVRNAMAAAEQAMYARTP